LAWPSFHYQEYEYKRGLRWYSLVTNLSGVYLGVLAGIFLRLRDAWVVSAAYKALDKLFGKKAPSMPSLSVLSTEKEDTSKRSLLAWVKSGVFGLCVVEVKLQSSSLFTARIPFWRDQVFIV
jgi:TctA family transporter